jgi:CBS domain-containing protein
MISMNPVRNVRDVMAAEPLRVEASTTVRQLARLLSESDISGAPVVNQEGAMIGVVSKTELLRACSAAAADCTSEYLFEVAFDHDSEDEGQAADAIAKPLASGADVLRHAPVTVTPDTPIDTIVSHMLDGRIHRIIVVEAEMLHIVIITTLDLLGAAPHKYPGARRGPIGPREASRTINQRSTS